MLQNGTLDIDEMGVAIGGGVTVWVSTEDSGGLLWEVMVVVTQFSSWTDGTIGSGHIGYARGITHWSCTTFDVSLLSS